MEDEPGIVGIAILGVGIEIEIDKELLGGGCRYRCRLFVAHGRCRLSYCSDDLFVHEVVLDLLVFHQELGILFVDLLVFHQELGILFLWWVGIAPCNWYIEAFILQEQQLVEVVVELGIHLQIPHRGRHNYKYPESPKGRAETATQRFHGHCRTV